MKVKYIFLVVFLLFGLVKSSSAILWINNFETGADAKNLGWSVVNMDDNNTTHPAEATAKVGYIASATGEYRDGAPADDDEADWGGTYNDQYFSLYVWGNGDTTGTKNFQIQIVEEDDMGGVIIPDTWSTAQIPLDWTGWRYFMFQLPGAGGGNNFPTDLGVGNDIWDPSYAPGSAGPPVVPECRGVKQINFVTTDNIYIDEVVISNVSSSVDWVQEIFPSNDNAANTTDIILPKLPPTISAVLGGNADTTNNKIVVIENSNPTVNLCSSNGAYDGVGGWLVTPSAAAYVSGTYPDGTLFTVFIHPANGSEPGRCEVITFTIATPATTIQNLYKRSLTN